MARARYYVLSDGDRWKVRLNGDDFPYATQSAAIRAAVDAAHESGRNGHDAQVLIQSSGGQWRAEWTYGHDPYPPKG